MDRTSAAATEPAREGLYRAVMEQLAHGLITRVGQGAPADDGFEETADTPAAAALRRTVREQPAETITRFFPADFDGLGTQRLSHLDEEAEHTCLQAFVSAVMATAGG
ncbi:hypothetical protein ABT147_00680 [Streptomyces sp. NPDC001868]|uniref:hypothetical protein n=1 Tax=Streptomyces sp. NPDC001868 TaxID=3154401 RepID=UPI00333225EF